MEEKQDESLPPGQNNTWVKRSMANFGSDKKTRTHLDTFMAEIKQTGVSPEGIVLCNCEVMSALVGLQKNAMQILQILLELDSSELS